VKDYSLQRQTVTAGDAPKTDAEAGAVPAAPGADATETDESREKENEDIKERVSGETLQQRTEQPVDEKGRATEVA
jgi:hypothetical protein